MYDLGSTAPFLHLSFKVDVEELSVACSSWHDLFHKRLGQIRQAF